MRCHIAERAGARQRCAARRCDTDTALRAQRNTTQHGEGTRGAPPASQCTARIGERAAIGGEGAQRRPPRETQYVRARGVVSRLHNPAVRGAYPRARGVAPLKVAAKNCGRTGGARAC